MIEPTLRSWAFSLPFLPPSVNHQYGVDPRTGRRYLTENAVMLRTLIRSESIKSGFRPDKAKKYGVYVVLTMTRWDDSDVDSPLKAALDSALSSRTDHRVIRLLVDKCVDPTAAERCDITIYEMTALCRPNVAALFGVPEVAA